MLGIIGILCLIFPSAGFETSQPAAVSSGASLAAPEAIPKEQTAPTATFENQMPQ